MHRCPPTYVCSSVAPTFGMRSCSLKNRALARDILKKSSCFTDSRSKKVGDIALKVLLVEGPDANRSRLDFAKLRSSAGHPQNSRFSVFKNCAPERDNSIFCVLIILVSSKIAPLLEASSKFCQLIFLKIDQDCAPVRSIRKILIIDERSCRRFLYQSYIKSTSFEVALLA